MVCGIYLKPPAAVWVGFDDMRSLGPQETGARAASPIWVHFMKNFASGRAGEFPVPEGIVSVRLTRDRTSGA